MRSLPKLLLAALTLLPIFSMACTREVPVQVPVPAPSCDLGQPPAFPSTTAKSCGELVCLPPAEITSIWVWAREMVRRDERARVCVDAQSFAPAKPDPLDPVRAVVSELGIPGVTVTVKLDEKCGAVNAFYFGDGTILVCAGLLKQPPGLIRYIVAHELGHALIHQLDLPVTGSREDAADEFAATFMALLHPDDLRFAEAFWLGEMMHSTEPWDAHRSGAQRYHVFRCYRLQVTENAYPPTCWANIQVSLRTWARLLELQ